MNKQTGIILLIAIALVGLLLIFENPFKKEEPKPRVEDQVQLFEPLAEENCSRIELKTMGTTTTLVRRDGRWLTHDGYKADPDAVLALFRALEETGDPELRSIRPEAFMRFRVDAFLGTHLRMYDTAGNLKVNLIVGELEQDFFHTPVRRPDSSNVYVIRSMLRNDVRRQNWRDQNIFRFDMPELRRVAVQRAGESYVVERESEAAPWHFCEPTSEPVDAKKVQSWLQRIARLRADDLAESTTATEMLTSFGLTTPAAQLTVGLADNTSHTVVFGNRDDQGRRFYAKRIDDPQVYWLAQYNYDLLLQKMAELKPAPKMQTPRVPPPPKPRVTTGTAPTTPPLAPPAATTGTATVPAPTKPLEAPSSQPAAATPPPKADEPATSTAADKPTTAAK